jgi:hypothetical protein
MNYHHVARDWRRTRSDWLREFVRVTVSVPKLSVRVMVVLLVVIAPLWCPCQLALEKGSDELIDRRGGITGANFNAALSEDGEGPLSDSSGNHDLHSLIAQLARQ